jgi:ABC-2 type transport system ATP-binding protein
VPQQPALYSKLSVAENLAMFARLEHVADPQQAVERMLEQTGLRERAAELLGRLSGGNRQRVNVAIGLLSSPPVLALDEPSTALDPVQRERLWSFIRGLAADGTSVVFSTHDVNEVQRYAARALVLADGRLLFDGSPAAFLAAAGEQPGGGSIGDFEDAFVSFLRARSHR